MTDPSTKADVPPLARMLGHTVEGTVETGGTLRVTVRTKGNPA
jgi:TusA-related sulfurtransferase